MHVETAVFDGSLDEVRIALQSEQSSVLAFVTSTDHIPAVLSLTPRSGEFYDVGATRRVNLDGGEYAVERIVESGPAGFTYQVWNFTASSARAIDHIKGNFTREPIGGVPTRVIWTYTVASNSFVARPFVRRFLCNDFAQFMVAGLQGAATNFNERVN